MKPQNANEEIWKDKRWKKAIAKNRAKKTFGDENSRKDFMRNRSKPGNEGKLV